MSADHTPTPWRVFSGDKSSVYSDDGDVFIVQVGDDILCVDGETVPDPDEAVSNAAFIVRACNAHYQMLEALKHAEGDLEATERTETLSIVRAAIAAAEAEGR